MGREVEVAVRAPVASRLAPPGEAYAAAVAHPGGDVHAQALDRPHGSRTVAGRAGVLDHRAGAAAARAGLGDGEHPLPLCLDTATLAARAHRRCGAGLGAGPVTGRAGRMHGHLERHLSARDGLVEGDRDLRFEVRPAFGAWLGADAAPAGRAAEEVREDVPHRGPVEVEVAKAPEPSRGTCAGGEGTAAAVVLLALLGVPEHVMGLGDLLEARLGGLVVGVSIGVVTTGELAVGLLDFLRRRPLLHPERLVVVGSCCHLFQLS